MESARLAFHPAPTDRGSVRIEPDDRECAAAMRAGDVTALDALYRRYQGIALATALAILRDPAAAEDVVHDAFLRAWRSAASYQPERGPLRAWLMTVVRNTAIDHLRARQLATRRQPLLADTTARVIDPDPLTAVTAAAEAQRLRQAMATLPDAQRHALELAYFAGLTHGEIASRTGAPLGTVKGRVRLGLGRLRQALGELAHDAAGLAPCPLAAQSA